MNEETAFYRLYLQEELARRCDRNASYSLRAFSKALNVDVGNLSRVLKGKSSLSPEVVERIVERLNLAPDEQQLFLQSVLDEQKNKKIKGLRRSTSKQLAKLKTNPTLDVEMFRVISDWYHFAILELTFVEGFKSDLRWIAKKLGISPLEAKLAIERLIKLGLLEEKDGRFIKTEAHITTRDKHLTTPALKKLQRELLEKAIFSLENVDIEKRSQTGMTMSIDPQKLPIAKKMIEEFANQICQVLETGKRKKVYQLSVSLFPLQKEE